MTPPGAVFDAVTFVQALANPAGPAAACWERVRAGELVHYTSGDTLAELADVVSRPKLVKKLRIAPEIARTFLESVRAQSTLVTDVPVRFRYDRDPKDEPLVNLALASEARYLVTWDKDLLDLSQDENAAGEALKAQAPDLTILTPPDLLRILRTTDPSSGLSENAQ
ncbi:putative toxin-antitoxin system toxin component, PIN family [Fimbriiglobus ruber]|uniref:PIN domain-containing protein n=1 Tax=Fimbriiglobus ruber TaxID=1908690 RepID=A0A225D4T4_9BACT|nr:putative toxin-antitoxin system toxin component, PIN family [Fimbriiglobus ruber]OWK36611.1 hypothetical protein FRUB_09174 [Fimbriiglobus ruber]